MTFSYAPFNLWPIAIISLVAACYVTDKHSTRSAAKYGFAFGFGWFALGISWVHVSIAQFGGLPLPVSLLLMGLLCAYLAIYPALAFAFAARFSQSAWSASIGQRPHIPTATMWFTRVQRFNAASSPARHT